MDRVQRVEKQVTPKQTKGKVPVLVEMGKVSTETKGIFRAIEYGFYPKGG